MAGSLCLVLHPIVLARPLAMGEVRDALESWQSALLLGLPASALRTGAGPLDLVERIDRVALRRLQEVGTTDFAHLQLAARHAIPGFIVRSQHSVDEVRLVGRSWDGDLLVSARVEWRIWHAELRANGSWERTGAFVARRALRCRLHKALGVWRIESVDPSPTAWLGAAAYAR